MGLYKKLSCLIISAFFIFFLSSCGETVTVKVGVLEGHNEYWEVVKTSVKKKGINLKYVRFSDKSMPNKALSDGIIDMNSFQNYAFLNKEIKTNNYEITPICNTVIFPLGIYSDTVKDIKSFKKNSKIAISNDPTDKGRSLKLLESAGLIKIDPEKGFMPKVEDITVNPLNLKFVDVNTSQIISLLPTVDAIIINGNDAKTAELIPDKDSIYLEQAVNGTINPFINILVVRETDKNNKTYKIIAETVNSPAVKKKIKNLYKGILMPAF